MKSIKINNQQKQINDGVNVIKKLSKYNLQEKLNSSAGNIISEANKPETNQR